MKHTTITKAVQDFLSACDELQKSYLGSNEYFTTSENKALLAAISKTASMIADNIK